MSVYGKNHVGLGENHVILWEKSCQLVGKIRWSENLIGKNPHIHRKKIPEYLHLFAEALRLTTSI